MKCYSGALAHQPHCLDLTRPAYRRRACIGRLLDPNVPRDAVHELAEARRRGSDLAGGSLNYRLIVRRGLLVVALLSVVAVAWGLIAGALRQLPRSVAPGQQIETAIQMACGLLSLLVVATCFRWRRSARRVRAAWAASLAATSGLSTLVWGPPMPGVGLLFASGTLLVALGLVWALRFALEES